VGLWTVRFLQIGASFSWRSFRIAHDVVVDYPYISHSHGRAEVPRSWWGSTPIVITNEPSRNPTSLSHDRVAVLQPTKSWEGEDLFGHSKAITSELDHRSVLPKSELHSVLMVQPRYETPIKPTFERSLTLGILGMGNECWFVARHAEAAVLFFSARAMNSSLLPLTHGPRNKPVRRIGNVSL